MRLPFFLANPAAAQNAFTVIEYCALSGGDRSLRSVKDDARVRVVHGRDGGFGGNVLVTDLHGCAHRSARDLMRDPIHLLHVTSGFAQGLVISDDNAIILAVN